MRARGIVGLPTGEIEERTSDLFTDCVEVWVKKPLPFTFGPNVGHAHYSVVESEIRNRKVIGVRMKNDDRYR